MHATQSGLSRKDAILIVDDDSDVLEALEDELKEYYDVTALLSGQQALALLQGQAFAAIISDVRMPGIDGLTLIRECAIRYPEMVRILLTAFDDEDVQEMAMGEYGAYKLAKPWGDDLIVTLQNALKQRRSTVDLQKSIDMVNAAFDLDLRLHLNLKPDQVLPSIVSEILRVPEVLSLAVYLFDKDGKPKDPLHFGTPPDGIYPQLSTRRVTPPEKMGAFYQYTITIGQWPVPWAACVCQISKETDTSLRYLDYVARQGYRTLCIVNSVSAAPSPPHDRISQVTAAVTYLADHTRKEERLIPSTWIAQKLSIPETVIVSAAQSIREMSSNLCDEDIRQEMQDIASDLDSAYNTLHSIQKTLTDDGPH